MRVLYLINSGEMGGIQRHVQCLSNCMRAGLAEAAVCIVRNDANEFGPLMRADGTKVYELGCRSGHDWHMFSRLHRVLKEFKPDLVHCHGDPLFVLIYFGIWARRMPVACSLHVSEVPKYSLKHRFLKFLRWRIDYFLPVSQFTLQRYFCWNPHAKGEVFFNPMRMEDLPAKDRGPIRSLIGVDESTPVIGLVGRLSRQKGWQLFLDICNRVLRLNPVVHVAAVGDGEERQQLHDRWIELTADDLDVQKRLHWLGLQANAKALIGGMDVFVMTSLFEEMPTILLEAFAMKTPVVGTIPRGGVKEVIALAKPREIGIYDEQSDPAKLAEGVLHLLIDRKKAEEFVANAYEVLSRYFDASRLCREKLLPIYQKLIANKGK